MLNLLYFVDFSYARLFLILTILLTPLSQILQEGESKTRMTRMTQIYSAIRVIRVLSTDYESIF